MLVTRYSYYRLSWGEGEICTGIINNPILGEIGAGFSTI